LGQALWFAGVILFETGDRAGTEVLLDEHAELAKHSHDLTLGITAMTWPSVCAYLDGRMDEAVALAEAAVARAREMGVGGGGVGVFAGLVQMRVRLGSASLEEIDAINVAANRPNQASRAAMLAQIGHHAEARTIIQGFGEVGSNEDESAVLVLIRLFEAAIAVADEETARGLSRRLMPLASELSWSLGGPVSVARLLGEAAALLGEREKALSYYEQALEVCRSVRHRPEIALTRLALAELLLDGEGAEQEEAQGHLDFAIDEFRSMKMQPALERALRHKGLLHA
jgi:tetratricopeptide (TPR) repeat protein